MYCPVLFRFTFICCSRITNLHRFLNHCDARTNSVSQTTLGDHLPRWRGCRHLFWLLRTWPVKLFVPGGVGERLKPAVLKTVRPERVSWVRIPPPPPLSQHLLGQWREVAG